MGQYCVLDAHVVLLEISAEERYPLSRLTLPLVDGRRRIIRIGELQNRSPGKHAVSRPTWETSVLQDGHSCMNSPSIRVKYDVQCSRCILSTLRMVQATSSSPVGQKDVMYGVKSFFTGMMSAQVAALCTNPSTCQEYMYLD